MTGGIRHKAIVRARPTAVTLLIVSRILTSDCSLPAHPWSLVTGRWPEALAQTTNGTTTVMRETVVSGGGRIGSGNPMSALIVLGEPMGGGTANGSFTVRMGGGMASLASAGGTKTIAVEGTTNDPTASITVNGAHATVSGTTYRADGIILMEGPNTLTVTATDPLGNRSSLSITVQLDTWPPAKPTVVTQAVVTTASYTLTGTKTPGASVWVNGVEVVPLNDATSWAAVVTLVEGDNVLVIVTKDAVGNTSATTTVTIVVDNLPPVIGVTAPNKTNFSPLTIAGTVDDSLTTVEVNGVAASRTGRAFSRALPLVGGPNPITITATSPNRHVSTQTLTVTLGSVPIITATVPPDGTKLSAGTPSTIQISATDQEGDPISYQVALDGVPLGAWAASPTQPWTPTTSQVGLHTVTASVRDAYGGSTQRELQVFVVRPPVQHP